MLIVICIPYCSMAIIYFESLEMFFLIFSLGT